MICKYVHHDVEVKGKAQDFAHKFNKSKISNPFEVENFLLHRNMQLEVIKVIKPFFGVFEVF
jgi:hypothetical protein